MEEALANAVYHKCYELAKPIEVQIWPDRIEILSFPGPVPPVDAKIIAKNKRIVARDYRNRRVGDFLKELHLTEGRGTGIPTMKRTMIQNGSSEPILETDDQCTYFLTVLPVHPEGHPNNLSDHVENTDNKEVTKSDDQVSDQVSDQVNDQVNPRIIEILEYCTTPKTSSDILNHLGITAHTTNYKKYIQFPIDNQWIRMTIPDKPRSRNQKYVITDKGRKLIDQLNQKKNSN